MISLEELEEKAEELPDYVDEIEDEIPRLEETKERFKKKAVAYLQDERGTVNGVDQFLGEEVNEIGDEEIIEIAEEAEEVMRYIEAKVGEIGFYKREVLGSFNEHKHIAGKRVDGWKSNLNQLKREILEIEEEIGEHLSFVSDQPIDWSRQKYYNPSEYMKEDLLVTGH